MWRLCRSWEFRKLDHLAVEHDGRVGLASKLIQRLLTLFPVYLTFGLAPLACVFQVDLRDRLELLLLWVFVYILLDQLLIFIPVIWRCALRWFYAFYLVIVFRCFGLLGLWFYLYVRLHLGRTLILINHFKIGETHQPKLRRQLPLFRISLIFLNLWAVRFEVGCFLLCWLQGFARWGLPLLFRNRYLQRILRIDQLDLSLRLLFRRCWERVRVIYERYWRLCRWLVLVFGRCEFQSFTIQLLNWLRYQIWVLLDYLAELCLNQLLEELFLGIFAMLLISAVNIVFTRCVTIGKRLDSLLDFLGRLVARHQFLVFYFLGYFVEDEAAGIIRQLKNLGIMRAKRRGILRFASPSNLLLLESIFDWLLQRWQLNLPSLGFVFRLFWLHLGLLLFQIFRIFTFDCLVQD